MKRQSKGITLIALVITIIILLILAGISIASLTGSGLFERAKEAKEQTENKNLEETIKIAYNSAITEQYLKEENIRNTFEKELQKQYDGVTVEGDEEPYIVTIPGRGIYEVRNGNVTKLLDAKYIPNINYIIGKTQDATEDINGEGTLEKDDKAYVIVTIKIQDGEISSVAPGEGLILVSNNNEKYTFSAIKDGKYNIQIVSNQGKDYEYTMNCPIKIEDTYKIANIPEEWKLASSSNTNNDWYEYKDVSNNTTAKTNEPILQGNMRAIKYIGETPNTGSSRWANAMTSDGSMWVWIPRYAYKITSGYHANTGKIEIKFLDTNNKCLDGSSEVIVTDPSQITYDGDKQNEWLLHPAFSSSSENGGGFGEISGFWFAKFETSGEKIEETGFKSVAGVKSLREVSIEDFYKYARQQLYGETGIVDSDDNYISFGQSHIIKNSEWGAVAYLSYSSYGSNGTKVTNNNSDCVGGNSTISTIYTTNSTQSTTQNAYGIYDMNGGAYEYVASYLNNGYTNLTGSGTGTSTKYKTAYKKGSKDDVDFNYNENSGIKGDAVYETSTSGYSYTASWESVGAFYPNGSYPIFMRGGCAGEQNSGIFYFNYNGGVNPANLACRLALVF